jgi:hypothetical protein
MNQVIQFFSKPLVQVIIIIILLAIIIWLVSENFSNISDTFTDEYFVSNDDFNRRPPHIEQLPHQQLVPQDPPAASQDPSSSDRDGMSIGPPNFGRKNQENTLDNTRMVLGNIYRMNTGRDAYQEEQFVSIYDANFGGMLGTNMGL